MIPWFMQQRATTLEAKTILEEHFHRNLNFDSYFVRFEFAKVKYNCLLLGGKY